MFLCRVIDVSLVYVCVCAHMHEKYIYILDVRPSFFQDIRVDSFCHAAAVVTSVEFPEELGFCCANHLGKVLGRQQSLSSVAARIY